MTTRTTGATHLAAVGAVTVRTTTTQDYFNALVLNASQVLESTMSGTLFFHSTVDGLTAGGQALTTRTDGTVKFGDSTLPAPTGVVGSQFALASLTVEGNTLVADGTTDLNAVPTTAGGVTIRTTGNQVYSNPVTLTTDQILVSTSPVGAITFDSTVDGH